MFASVPQQIVGLIVEQLDCRPPADVDGTTPLFEGGLELDSFAAVELIVLIETHFKIELEVSDIVPAHFVDINAVGQLVERYLSR